MDLLDTHARMRIPPGHDVRPLRDVLAQREFHGRRSTGEFQFVAGQSPPKFDDLALPADRIRRAVQDHGGRNAAGQLPVNVDVVGVDEVADAHLASDRPARLVDAPVGRDVRMWIDQSGRQCRPPRSITVA